MKYIKYFLFVVFFISIFSLSKLDAFAYIRPSPEKESDIITQEESEILNKVKNFYMKNSYCSFDFALKKVAFYTGSGAGARSNKISFFREYTMVTKQNPESVPAAQIYVFDETEKARADGYDAVIVYGSVKQFPSKETLIRRLHKFKLFK